MSKQDPPLPRKEVEEDDFKKLNRRRLLAWSLLSLGGFWGLTRLPGCEEDRGLPWPLRRGMENLDAFWKANFNPASRAPQTPPTTERPRLNGDIGMEAEISDWKLELSASSWDQSLYFSLEDIKKIPAVSESFEFKCIEGWSREVTCKGVRFRDFVRAQEDLSEYDYCQLTSVNGGYYVSMDTKSLFHPQTLLCYEMNGRELAPENGYPLRLITPLKYGVKNIKQIGRIAFMDSPPADYWAERGYGDYLGL